MSLCCEGCFAAVIAPLAAVRSLSLAFVLIVIKVYLPCKLYEETELSDPATDAGQLVIGSAAWAMVMFLAEEDILRDVWWIVVHMKMRGQERATSEYDDMFRFGSVNVGACLLSLVYDTGSGVIFGFCTWG